MRSRQVIVTKHPSITGREIPGAVVWGWSRADGVEAGGPSVVDDAIPGDYVIHHDSWTLDGRRRLRPWTVHRARKIAGARFQRRLANVSIGCGGCSTHRTVEAAVKAAAAMLRRDEAQRAASAAAACSRGETVACPDQHTCRHGIDN